MIAQAILSILLLTIMFYAWLAARRAPIVGILFFGVALLGFYFVWIPQHATAVARLMGIGRGVDLVIYLWIVVSLLAILNLHLQIRSQLEIITSLARHIAISDARKHASEAPDKQDTANQADAVTRAP